MGFISSVLGILGFGIGIPIGLLVGYFIFIYYEPRDVKDPIVRPLQELDSNTLLELLNELPLWVKNPDYDRVDWLNRFILDMWPYLDKGICGMIRSTAKPIFSEYIGKFKIKSIDFECLTLGTLPPTIHAGVKVYETNEKELVLEPVIRWAGNPNIILVVKFLSLRITVQLVDLQIFVTPRVSLKPLVPTFPCFSSIEVSLMEKPHVDFGMKVLGGDIMAIPGLYRYVQETIRKQVASLYLWPQILEIPILDSSVGATKKPVGILLVKVVRALKLLKMDFLGTSDPYVILSLSGERLPPKKTTVKMKNLNPEWNEEFKLIVKDPETQVLELHVNDWEKVGTHDKLGMQVIPLRLLVPQETKSFTLDLVKNMNPNDPHNMKHRGKIEVELTFNPFREENDRFSGPLDGFRRKESEICRVSEEISANGAGLLSVTVQAAEDVEGKKHNNPYALVFFRGEQKKTKMIRKTRDPCWDEEFQFMLEEAPINDKIHIEVMSKRTALGFRSKESLGHVDINLIDVVNNGRINEKYHLINSKNGMIHVEIRWKTI
ncbi:C2 calcium-dependent membrane targeting [Macleaya cordata]|uniref:C2 calcium-dependent membrane targeting n=1 Tax=Macleaya cordata TaxID=56857 RepID=A0A200R5P8_MACCD|nr:C2 calcium-dependent membrane targeting [Macleaya cordata]